MPLRNHVTVIILTMALVLFNGRHLGADGFPNFTNGNGGDWGNGYYRAISVSNSSGVITDYQIAITPFTDISFLNNTGLVGSWHFSEATGTNTADMSGNGNNGTINGATWTDGKFGKALLFNGKDNYVSIPTINLGSTFTVEFWMQPTNLHDYGDPLSAGTTDSWLTFVTYADGHMSYVIGNGMNGFNNTWGNAINTPAGEFVNGKWYHIAGIYDGNQIELFINGVSKGKAVNKGYSINQIITIGARTATGYYFDGLIDEVRLYNRALSAGEVKTRYDYYTTKIRADYADARFTTPDGKTELAYWQETDNRFWIKIPSLPPGDSTINMYYGNVSATSTSNGNNTFIFFDDFETYPVGSQINGQNGWSSSQSSANMLVQNDAASHGTQSLRGDSPNASTRPNATKSFNPLDYDVCLEYDVRTTKPTGSTYDWTEYDWYHGATRTQYNTFWRNYDAPWGDKFISSDGVTNNALITYTINTWYNIKIWLKPSTKKQDIWIDNVKKITDSNWANTEATGIDKFYMEVYGPDAQVSWIDNMRIRKYTSPEPLVGKPQTELKPQNYIALTNPTDLNKGRPLKSGENNPQLNLDLRLVPMVNANQKSAHWKRLKIDKYVPPGTTAVPDDKIEVSVWAEANNNGQWDAQDTLISKGKFLNGTLSLELKDCEIITSTQTFYLVYNIASDAESGQRAGLEIKDTAYLEFTEPDIWVRYDKTTSFVEIPVPDIACPANQDAALEQALKSEASNPDYKSWSPYYDLVSKTAAEDRDNLAWRVTLSYHRPIARSVPGQAAPPAPGAADLIRVIILPHPLKPEIEKLIKLLGDDDWQIREKATSDLTAIGRPARTLVKEALTSPDPEVRMRAKLILESLK